MSPSSRRAWIEIFPGPAPQRQRWRSPSSRRAWIEITYPSALRRRAYVALLAEGVDRNTFKASIHSAVYASPSSRRAWIEIGPRHDLRRPRVVALLAEGVDRNTFDFPKELFLDRRPPRGGRG